MLASKGGHTETVLLLLEHLPEINVVNVVSCVHEYQFVITTKICTLGEDKQGDLESLKAMSSVNSHIVGRIFSRAGM